MYSNYACLRCGSVKFTLQNVLVSQVRIKIWWSERFSSGVQKEIGNEKMYDTL